MTKPAPFLALFIPALIGCVSSGTHQAALDKLGTARQENNAITEELDNARQELIRTRLVLDAASKEMMIRDLFGPVCNEAARTYSSATAVVKKSLATGSPRDP